MLVPMDFQDVVRRRRMVRSYTTEPVDPAVLDRILTNATRAPSAGFSQGSVDDRRVYRIRSVGAHHLAAAYDVLEVHGHEHD